jgi:hypothetical protein
MGLRSGDCYRLDVSVAWVQAMASWALLQPIR